jgi:hypothetical protein
MTREASEQIAGHETGIAPPRPPVDSTRDAERPKGQRKSVREVIDFVIHAIDAAKALDKPFHHLQFANVFPPDIYAEMLRALPVAADYRPLPGRHNENLREDGTSTRVKIDLFPEYIRHLLADKRGIWEIVGRALCSSEVQAAFIRRLAPGLERRFGRDYADVGMYPIPVLTRDIPGYSITPHTDTHWKAITVQLYLPRDESHPNIGTLFLRRAADGSFARETQMRFAPNTGYAFAVGDDTWHSADPVGQEVDTRDSILLTYFADNGLLRFLRNRAKRVGNLVRNEVRHLTGQ